MRYRQHDATDCGVACLRFIAAHYGKRCPNGLIRSLTGTGVAGSSALALIEAAAALGLDARGVRGAPEHLVGVPLPAIAHCSDGRSSYHYVVLVKWRRAYASVMDPASGRITRWSHGRFVSAWTGVLLLCAPRCDFEPGELGRPAWRRLIDLIRPHRSVVFQLLVGAVATTAMGLGTSVYVQKIVDNVVPDGNLELLNILSMAMVTLLVLRLAIGWMQSRLTISMAQAVDAGLILAYYRHLIRLPHSFFVSMRVGEITSRVGDAIKIRNFLNTTLVSLMLNPLILLFSLTAMFFYSWQLAALSLILLPANALVYVFINLANRELQRGLMERSADLDAHLVQAIGAQSLVRQYGLELQTVAKTEVVLFRLLRSAKNVALSALACNSVGAFIAQAYGIGLLWLGAVCVLQSKISMGEVMSCHTLATYLSGPIASLLNLNASVQEALVATDRLFETMDQQMEADAGQISFERRHATSIEFDRVTFKHPGKLPTFRDICTTFVPGEIAALTGPPGSGKSSLLALIQRLHAPSFGRVLIGGHDLRHFTLSSLRRHVGVVSQAPVFLSGTILENLAPGDPHPNVERLLGLCQQFGILEYIESLPQGLTTQLNENGAGMSGGQRQLLAVVRCLYFDAPILILDEPTSALDSRSERLVISCLAQEARKGKIVLVAAHSARVVAEADQIFRFENGCLSKFQRGQLQSEHIAAKSQPPNAFLV